MNKELLFIGDLRVDGRKKVSRNKRGEYRDGKFTLSKWFCNFLSRRN
jgi:hypothetical protein